MLLGFRNPAYDTVCHPGIVDKFIKVISCRKLCMILNHMISNRKIIVRLESNQSKIRILNNNSYMNLCSLRCYLIYILLIQHVQISKSSFMLTQPSKFKTITFTIQKKWYGRISVYLIDYFKKWCLALHIDKTVVSRFNLNIEVTIHGLYIILKNKFRSNAFY